MRIIEIIQSHDMKHKTLMKTCKSPAKSGLKQKLKNKVQRTEKGKEERRCCILYVCDI